MSDEDVIRIDSEGNIEAMFRDEHFLEAMVDFMQVDRAGKIRYNNSNGGWKVYLVSDDGESLMELNEVFSTRKKALEAEIAALQALLANNLVDFTYRFQTDEV